MARKVLTIITHYNRQQNLFRLYHDLLCNKEVDVVIFDDLSDDRLAFDVKFLQDTHVHGEHLKLITAPEHRGKAGFWKTYDDIFAYCKEHEYDYYMILPDDVEPCPNFIEEAIASYEESGCICLSPLLTNRSLLPGISRWGKRPIIRRDWGYETSYFDCCGIMKRDFFECLNWHMLPIMPSSNPYRSSGVGRQITTRLQAAGKRMGHVSRTLLSITEHGSQMNSLERKRHPMYADWRDNEPCVDVHMASLWRNGHVLKTIESLMQQPELERLFLTLNNYTDEQYAQVKEGIQTLAMHYGKTIVTRRAKNKKGSNEKLSQLSKSTSRYIAFADDDIIYPVDYLFRLIGGCNVHNAAVSLHGSLLKRFPIKKYYNGDRQMLSWNITIDEDKRVDLIGTGLGLIRREWFSTEELKALYATAPTISMDDIIISCALAKKGIERWVLEHRSGCIKIKAPADADAYVYDQYKDNDKAQVDYINANYKK